MATKWVEVPADAYGYRAPGWPNQMENMPEANCSNYDKCDLWILDDVLRGPNVQGGAGSPGSVQHESLCNDVYDLFSRVFTDCTVHSLRMQPGQKEEDFSQRIAAILEQYTSRDLVIFYYQGKAGEKGEDYTWRFRGPGPRHINAYDFIRQVNGSRADCYFILDCFIPTNFPKKWMRKNAMTEFSITGHQMRDDHGRPINSAGNFTESLCRAVRDIADKPRGDLRQSLHHIMRRDKKMCSRPIRLWTARPNRRKRNKVWRIFVDIGRFKENGRFQLRKCKITGRRKGDGEFDRDSDDGGDDDESDDGGENGSGNGDDGGDGNDGDDDGGRRPGGGCGRGRVGGRRPGNDDNGEDDHDGPGPDPEGGDRGGGNAAPDGPDGTNNGARTPHLFGNESNNNDNREQQVPKTPRLGGPLIKRKPSTTPSSGKKTIKRSRSSSPFFDFGGLGRLGSERPVKRERSDSPEVEVVSSRPVRAVIDLTLDGEVVDLTQEDGPEESLFVPLD